MRTIEWDYKENKVQMIDQRQLPSEFKIISYDDYHEVAKAIQDMVIRGAPAIGAAAAFGLALAAHQSRASDTNKLRNDLYQAIDVIGQARPTAVNLKWALTRIMNKAEESDVGVDDLRHTVLAEAQAIADEDVLINERMARNGAELIDDGDTIIHHCNTGALAAVEWGTALGVLRMAHELGKKIHVLLDETRPRYQGARLSAWELQRYGVPFDIISDNAAGYFLQSGLVKKVVFGADRVAANGDVANKIGTYMLALAAHDNGVPAYAVVPTSTVDLSLAHGGLIPIEERDPDEVLDVKARGREIAPAGSTARNPAFDITPNRLVTAIVTENGVVNPPFTENLAETVRGDIV